MTDTELDTTVDLDLLLAVELVAGLSWFYTRRNGWQVDETAEQVQTR